MARLANVVGDGNVGSPQLIDTHRPDAVRMERFRVVQEAAAGNRRKKGSALPATAATNNSRASQIDRTAAGFRFFRPGVPARVELRDGLPSRVSFQGLRGDVVAASGPWRVRANGGRRRGTKREWDVEVEFASPNAESDKAFQQFFKFVECCGGDQCQIPAPQLAYSRNINSSVKAAPARGLYLIYYDAREQNWFLRGTYD